MSRSLVNVGIESGFSLFSVSERLFHISLMSNLALCSCRPPFTPLIIIPANLLISLCGYRSTMRFKSATQLSG